MDEGFDSTSAPRTILLSRADRELDAGNVADALDLYACAGASPTPEQMVAAADRLLERGLICYALRLYRRARRQPDRRALLRAAARERDNGVIYPEVYDFLMTTQYR